MTEPRTKGEWREWMKKLLGKSDREARDLASSKVNEKIRQLLIETKINTLHTFLPKELEIDIYPVIRWAMRAKLTLVVPRVLDGERMEHLRLTDLDDLVQGMFGTKFPANGKIHPGPFDMIIVPGLSFDKMGYRIGYGKGYYDIFLSQQENAIKVGVCYPFQLVEKLPVEEHDIQMDLVLRG